MNIIAILTAARTRLAAGWCQESLIQHDGKVCAVGAVDIAMGYYTDVASCVSWRGQGLLDDAALLELERDPIVVDWLRLQENTIYNLSIARQACAYYNNTHSKDEVLAWFDRTIARLRAERGMPELRDLVNVPVIADAPATVTA